MRVSETQAYVLAHYNRLTLRRHPDEIAPFAKMIHLAGKIVGGFSSAGLLELGFGGYAITPAGREALRVWRDEHENEWPAPPWRRGRANPLIDREREAA